MLEYICIIYAIFFFSHFNTMQTNLDSQSDFPDIQLL